MTDYKDVIIIGGGVAGLAFANEVIKKNPQANVKIIEKDKSLGGCHKVDRKLFKNEYYFCEHAVRIYIGNYVNFISILKSMNLNFSDLFVKYKYDFISISNKFIMEFKPFTYQELFTITRDLLFTIISNNYGTNISVKDYAIINNFTPKAQKFLDSFCRTTDGGDASRISLNQFLTSTIQSYLYKIYVPRLPNDEGLFKYWGDYLRKNRVDIRLNSGVKELITDDKRNIKKVVLENGKEIEGDLFILAIPPESFVNIIKNNEKTIDAFGNFKELEKFAEKTDYNEYISMTFIWDYELKLEDKILTFLETEWELSIMIMSNYMKFKESKAKTVMSISVVLTDVKNSYLKKTANECNEEELINSVYQQILTIYKNIPEPTLYFLNSYYENDLKKWVSNNTAFIKVPNIDYIDFKSSKFKNLYNLGTHNGKHKNSFTSVESAVSNSIKLSNIIYEKKTRIKRCFDLRDLVIVLISLIIFLLLLTKIR